MKRRIICLLALLITAALLLVRLPGTVERLPGVQRGERELLRIWMISAPGGGQAWLTQTLRGYERAHPGVMTYLRTVTAEELTRPDAVLPDVVLYMPGDLTNPDAFAPLAGELAADEALLRCGRWRGQQLGLPLCWSGYVLVISAALDPTQAATPAPTTLLGKPAVTEAPSPTCTPGFPLAAAAKFPEPLQAPAGAALFALALMPDVCPALPENFGMLSTAEVYQRYLSGKCPAAMLTGGQLVALEGLAADGKAPAFRVMAPETVITDQVWLGSVVQGASPHAAELLGWLTARDAQKLLADQGLHPAQSSLRLYAAGAPALLDRAAERSLTAINAYIPAEDVLRAARRAFQGDCTLDEALLPLI